MSKYLLIFLLGSFLFLTGPNFAQTYVGESTCLSCHSSLTPDIVNNYLVSGHPYKLNEVSGAPPEYPENTSPGVPNPPPGTEWSEFSYVIGGYGWKARFVKPDGRIYTETEEVQYNLETGDWVAYHFGEDKKYDQSCFKCHATGATTEGSWNGVPEDSLGTFNEPGIRCEGCHGPGSEHASNPSVALPNVDEDLTITVCASCHQRGGVTNAIPASGGYIKHHEQINEMRASKHGDGEGGELTCASCHNAHIPLRYSNAAVNDMTAIEVECQTCHSDKQIMLNGEIKPIDCIDCHMPAASKSAVGLQVGNGWRGDVKTHIMKINTDAVTKDSMFTNDGSLVKLDENGLAAVTLDFACLKCHTSETVEWASSYAVDIHTNGITGMKDASEIPDNYLLSQNYPNPFNPATTIRFELPKTSKVKLSVYSINGELVAELINNTMPSGSHNIEFDGSSLSSGVYVYALTTDNFNATKKMILMK
ncbi:MAG: T9SS type A sorting domain-containing protein [Melioribacteraceae bacterium]|nr:T9SS type A sorting domain-containing protein [Melioribacteraceae bacterium]MCF8354921.1 T9SS type A sorting domain-containing protein [Melioribacteraceae bacterium]MCF8395246.1 T9SS type A sorting domain-containing protein [Melioribacteraceae bacterium]MCF8420708.1 T9SS type A sorting domain-containing protein [Melioribacteraceae bacterium]